MAVLRVEGLPAGALEAAAVFHAEWLVKARDLLDPPRNGEVARSDGGAGTSPNGAALKDSSRPLRPAFGGPPPRSGEDLVVVFPPADHTHRAWRLAAVQGLAREFAPQRVNAIASDDDAAIASALAYLEAAPGLTGQYLSLDGIGAGDVIPSPE